MPVEWDQETIEGKVPGAAIINALLDALRPLGVTGIPLPAKPETVWRAINEATSAELLRSCFARLSITGIEL